MTKRFGFTLAEVLITLGIIGVVAAMTIPTLVKNYQKQVWVNQLKKSVSTVENGFKLMLADEGVEKIEDTEFGRLCDNSNYATGVDVSEHNKILKKYFNIVKSFDISSDYYTSSDYFKETLGYDVEGNIYKILEGDNTENFDIGDKLKIYMADGAVYGLEIMSNGGDIWIDVNGDKKGPNQYGRDTFGFELKNTGQLIPKFGLHDANKNEYWKTTSNNMKTCNPQKGYGLGCAARIIESGWKMDY